jgi:hypothetical protein
VAGLTSFRQEIAGRKRICRAAHAVSSRGSGGSLAAIPAKKRSGRGGWERCFLGSHGIFGWFLDACSARLDEAKARSFGGKAGKKKEKAKQGNSPTESIGSSAF